MVNIRLVTRVQITTRSDCQDCEEGLEGTEVRIGNKDHVIGNSSFLCTTFGAHLTLLANPIEALLGKKLLIAFLQIELYGCFN